PKPPVPESIVSERARARGKMRNIVVPESLANLHPAVSLWIREDRREQKLDHPWKVAPRDGTDLGKRRLRICSALFKAVERLGYTIISEGRGFGCVDISNGRTSLQLWLGERIKQIRKAVTAEDRADGGY